MNNLRPIGDTEAERRRAERLSEILWAVAWVLLTVTLAVSMAMLAYTVHCRNETEIQRYNEACPSGTAARVVERVNAQPLVRACNHFAAHLHLRNH